ncbi:luciferin 4-monooxygenase-like [Trichogramma pretiosum]|uniref:luciferin 4-monooxygenase-like n=1 Tax=Trichogramma pretiosum TaxID=7493 RepID=UPI0006C98561|nr:luciferin 4-monooxygenase-like [Trichogramma pretiosum]
MGTRNLSNSFLPNFTIENNVLVGVKRDSNNIIDQFGSFMINLFDSAPNHVAQIDAETGQSIRFEEMKDNIIRCAKWLQKQCVTPNDVIAICTHNQFDVYVPCMATFIIGATLNPWPNDITEESVKNLIELTNPKIMFCSEETVQVVEKVLSAKNYKIKVVVFGNIIGYQSLSHIMNAEDNKTVLQFVPPRLKNLQNKAVILFSSGTTGFPKAVAFSYGSLNHILNNCIRNAMAPSTCLWYSSLYWITGLYYMISSIINKDTRIVHRKFTPIETCELIEKYKVNWFFMSSSMISQFCKNKIIAKYNLESLKIIMTGGTKLSLDTLSEFSKMLPHTGVYQTYGLTEIGGGASFQTPKCREIDSVGFVLPNVQIKIIDRRNGQTLGPNQPGELCIKSLTMMSGYYGNPEATKKVIDPYGWLHSGDIAYYKENGEVMIVERLKEIIKCRGHQIAPCEIEHVLMRHPGVMEVAVVSIPHDSDNERPVAIVKRTPGFQISEEELVEMSAKSLGNHKKLSGGVKFVKSLPYTGSGKIHRNIVKELARAMSDTSI